MPEALDPFQRRARLYPRMEPHDADTLVLEIDQGWYARAEPPLRLGRAFMPELSEPGGREMRSYVIEWINDWIRDVELDWPFWVVSTKTVRLQEPRQITTLGRFVTDVYRYNGRNTVGPSLTDVVNAELDRHPDWGSGTGGKAS
jgi:hypothetical protein